MISANCLEGVLPTAVRGALSAAVELLREASGIGDTAASPLVLSLCRNALGSAQRALGDIDAALATHVANTPALPPPGPLPADFSLATQRANSIDQIVAENMGAASLYVAEAETNLRLLRHRNPEEPEGWKDHQQKAAKSLNTAKYKLSVARTRWEAMAEQQP